MELKSSEHQDIIDQFDRESKGMRLDKESKDIWRLGRIYQDGAVNELFLMFRRGYALAKSVYQVGSHGTLPGSRGDDRGEVKR